MTKRYLELVFILIIALLLPYYAESKPISSQSVSCEDLIQAPRPAWPPEGRKIKCPVTRDTWVSSVGEEKDGSNGGAKRLKVKGNQEYILFDIDPSPLKRKIVTGALLHIRSASLRKAPLARLGTSTLASEWIEGNSKHYKPQVGSSCFNQAGYKRQNWAYPGSTLMDVTFGRGHTIWKFAECTKPDQYGWQTCAVDADVVAARIAGLSYGFCLYDEVGSVWSIKNGQFQFTYFPNRYCYSRENSRSASWFEVWVDGTDTIPPDSVTSIRVDNKRFPPGEALVLWNTPKDFGGGKTLGFQVSYERDGHVEQIPRYLIPMAGKQGQEVRMHIHDLPFRPGELVTVIIRPVDSSGNVGQPFIQTIKLSSNQRFPNIPELDIKTSPPDKNLPAVGGLKVGVVDLLDKIDPKNGKMIPARKEGYKGGNHLFSARKKNIRLQAARNETVSFQLNLEGKAQNISVVYRFDDNPNLKPKIFQFAYVNVVNDRGKTVRVLPDPLVPLTGTCSIPSTAGRVRVPDQTNHSLICELYIPHKEPPGVKTGKLSISVGEERLELNVILTVWNFTLPNKLSFVPEMNAYGTAPLYNDYRYYRLAHEHRTCLNWLPYGWHGLPFFAPEWKGDDFSWSEWDQKVGPLLDGSAFKNLPRKNEPVDVFYLPFSENWPINIFDNYKPSYWADEAFTRQYREDMKKAFAAFAMHCDEKRWYNTIFQFYLNNKVYYRKKFHQSSAPWIFDEPVNTQDFWALRWYGILWHSAVDPVKGNAKMWYRGDVSYNQFSRNMLWGVMNVEYIGSNNFQKTRMKCDEQIIYGKSYFSEYGSANKIEDSNTQPVFWCIAAWSKGAIGVLPWQTIGTENSWKKADQTALFYPHASGPKSSVRLKVFTRGQQDVEYLELLCDILGKPRYDVAKWLRETIDLKSEIKKLFHADAGTARFEKGDSVQLWKLRNQVGNVLSNKAPIYKRSLVELERIRWDPKKLPMIGYTSVAPYVEPIRPDCDIFRP